MARLTSDSARRNKKQKKRRRNAGKRVFLTSAPPPSSSAVCTGGRRRGRGSASSGTRSPVGVPPRRLLQRANAAAQFRARFLGRDCRRMLAAVLCPSPASFSQTGRSAGRAFYRSRPGAQVTSLRPREPHPLHQPVSPADVLRKRDLILYSVSEIRTYVNENVTAFLQLVPRYSRQSAYCHPRFGGAHDRTSDGFPTTRNFRTERSVLLLLIFLWLRSRKVSRWRRCALRKRPREASASINCEPN